MSTANDQGRFVWHELLTTDTDKAIAFYKDVVGWSTEAFADSPMQYTMWVGSEGPLGGVMKLPDEAAKMGAPPNWMSNVTVPDVDAAVAKTKERGGKLLSGPHDIPKIGRVAVISDPQGAAIAVFKPEGEMKSHNTHNPGEFTWAELYTGDPETALAFYAELFGWKETSRMDMGPMGPYIMYGNGGNSLGGMMRRPAEMPVSAWSYYVHVADLEVAVEKAKKGGARVINGPMDVPDGGRIAQLTDPQGAMFALHSTPGQR